MNAQQAILQISGRTRRRRGLAAGAAVAVLGTALVGGSALVGDDVLPTGGDSAVAAVPAAGGTGGGEAAPAAVPAEVPAEPVSLETSASPAAGEGSPPWQDSPPPLPEGGLEPENPDLPNAWEIPDARPTGVAALDAFGAPRMGMNYPRMVPVFDVMVCNTGAEDVEPLAGQDWMYYLDDTEPAGSIDIVVTGWEDSTAARDALRDDTMNFCVRDVAGDWEPLEWADHERDEDYLLYQAGSAGREFGFAIVRQGDYLVGVTVSDTTDNVETAAEIASRTADNLEALDPDHGRD